MTTDPDLDLWREQWQSETAVPEGLRAKVERQTRMLRRAVAMDVIVTVTMGGWTTTWAVISRREAVALLAVATWMFIAAAWGFVLVNMRGSWTTDAATTAEFLEVAARRCRARLRSVAFGAVLWVVEVGFCLGWIDRNYGRLDLLASGVVFSSTGVFLGLCVWYRRRQRSELTVLLGMQSETAPETQRVPLRTKRRKVWRGI